MNEIWKPVNGYEGLYEVSNLGRVKSVERHIERKGKHGGQLIHGKIKDFGINNKNYYMVNLYKNNHVKYSTVHRLVAEAFVPNPDPKLYTIINHIDENTLNNNAENLEWCTQKHNVNYGTCPDRIRNTLIEGGFIHPIKVVITSSDGNIHEFPSMKTAAKWLNVSLNVLAKMRETGKPSRLTEGYQIVFGESQTR